MQTWQGALLQSSRCRPVRPCSRPPKAHLSVPRQECLLQDFAKLQLEEIGMNISARRNRIFLLMEEVRRLRIQQRIKGGEKTREEEVYAQP